MPEFDSHLHVLAHAAACEVATLNVDRMMDFVIEFYIKETLKKNKEKKRQFR